jgi:hypothetical protein
MEELPNPPKGRIAPGSLLDTRDQFRLYRSLMGSDAALRQVGLTRQALADKHAHERKLGLRKPRKAKT